VSVARQSTAAKRRPGPAKQHDQYCPIARTLDLLGDRWSLLILREVLFGDRRFSDLRANLPGISPSLLSDRLQVLAAHGLVATRELPPPAARTVYTATPQTRAAVPVLQAMARFGMGLLAAPRASTALRPEMVAYGALTPWYDADAARDLDEVYALVIDGTPFTLTSARGGRLAAANRAPDVTLTAAARVLLDARRGVTTLADAIAAGRASIAGSKRALRNFQRVFHLP
jgi:DNA-binding HxlR family transcriptional regulator